MKIGITGGIGSGKTTVCKVFELLGVPVFYADLEAKVLMQKDELLISGIKSEFGKQSYFEDGSLNRAYLASRVFKEEKELERLNALVHPAVFKAFEDWSNSHESPYVIKEAALLFESASYKDCHYSILVEAPEDQRIQWVMKRDGITEAEVRNRMKRQWSDLRKAELADIILVNDEKQFLIPEILKLHLRFIKESSRDGNS